jgi:hypothetical protein
MVLDAAALGQTPPIGCGAWQAAPTATFFQFLMDKAGIFLHHRRSQTDQERNL